MDHTAISNGDTVLNSDDNLYRLRAGGDASVMPFAWSRKLKTCYRRW